MINYISIEEMLYGNYIQFNRLYNLDITALYKNKNINLDFYIDMNSMVSSLYRYKELYSKNYTELAAALINLCIHYRHYYWTRNRIHARIFLVYSDNFPEQNKFLVPEYNTRHYQEYVTNDRVTNMIKDNINLLDIICPYMYDVFFVHASQVETSAIIYDMIIKQDAHREQNKIDGYVYPNVVLSRDPYAYQLVGMCKRTFVFRPKKDGPVDYSWVVAKNNIFDCYEYELSNYVNQNTYTTNAGLLSLIWSIAGLRCRNINSIQTFKSSISIANKAIEDVKILPEYSYDIKSVVEALSEYSPKIANNARLIVNRFKAIDLIYNHLLLINSPGYISIYKNVINSYDPEMVKRINDEYFVDNPLELFRL